MAAAILTLGVLLCVLRVIWLEKVAESRWWRDLHEQDGLYVGFHDGSSDWLFKAEAFNSQPVWATGTFKRKHWWNRYWYIDEATIKMTDRWHEAQRHAASQSV